MSDAVVIPIVAAVILGALIIYACWIPKSKGPDRSRFDDDDYWP